jgi:outer membrane protein assembly factor BamB
MVRAIGIVVTIVAVCGCWLAGVFSWADDWPQFRGPQGDGVAAKAKLPTKWSSDENIAWRTEIPGRGWSSPVVVGDRVWLTAAEPVALPDAQRQDKLAKNKYGAEEFQVHGSVQLLAVEVDARSGKLLRRVDLATVDDPAPIHFVNGYASPTPVADGRRLYCHFGSLGTIALALDSGAVLWKQRFQVDEITGPGSSPVLWRNLLIFPCDGADQQYVVALQVDSGKIAWRAARPPLAATEGKHRRAFSTPLVVKQGEREQVIAPGAQWVVAYDPATGAEGWRVNFGDGHAVVPRPVYRQGVVYICTGYMKPRLWAIDAGGSGDVTETHVRWTFDKQVPEIASPLVLGNEIYFVSVIGVATCLDATDGRLLWQQRLGGNYGASPLAAGGKIYFLNQEGQATVLQAGREYVEVSRNQLPRMTLASPAVHANDLLIRTSEALFCIREP